MLCEICHKNEATIRFVMVVNGRETKINICEECAGAGFFFSAPEKSFNMLEKFLSSLTSVEPAKEVRCPDCGKRLSEFKADGKLGCPSCWDAFRTELIPLLKKLHGTGFHRKRKKPSASSAKKTPVADRLRAELKEAVEKEDYEAAAKLRDRIRALGSKKKPEK